MKWVVFCLFCSIERACIRACGYAAVHGGNGPDCIVSPDGLLAIATSFTVIIQPTPQKTITHLHSSVASPFFVKLWMSTPITAKPANCPDMTIVVCHLDASVCLAMSWMERALFCASRTIVPKIESIGESFDEVPAVEALLRAQYESPEGLLQLPVLRCGLD
jgi:hypothetical protein